MNATLIWIVVIGVVSFAVFLFVFDILRDAQEQNKDGKETKSPTSEHARDCERELTNLPSRTGGFGTWSKVALWLIVILLGINAWQNVKKKNEIMGDDRRNLTDIYDRMGRMKLY